MSPRKPQSRRRATAKSQQTEPAAELGWSPRIARPPIDRGEKLAIGVLFVAAVALRFSYQARISIEHWDEAVNASNLLLDGGYPNRFLYSPPLLPTLIEWSMLAFGKTSLAAVMPNLMLGSLTIPLCWWVGRDWFGPIAGIAAAALAALSDFQIVYSRTALTDAALGFWFLLAVYCSWRALSRNHLGEAVVAGLVIACAWATKYNGWLPLAVAISAFIAWGLFERFDLREWKSRLPAVAAIVVATGVCWSPVWLSLQPDGGYSAVDRQPRPILLWPGRVVGRLQTAGAQSAILRGLVDSGRSDSGLVAARRLSTVRPRASDAGDRFGIGNGADRDRRRNRAPDQSDGGHPLRSEPPDPLLDRRSAAGRYFVCLSVG